MLDVRIFFKALALFTAAALIIYAVTPPTGIDFLLKLIALDIGLAILAPFAYPSIRGVRNGDAVLVLISERELPFGMLPARSNASASSNGRIGSRIKVRFRDGSEEECVVVSYAGMFTPAKVKILEREIRVV
jgi:hypothetical protein